MPDFPKSMTSDEMAGWILGTSLRNAFGEMDYNDAKQIADAADEWILTDLPVKSFPEKWFWVEKPKTWGIPAIVLEVGPKEYEVLDGRHRIGYARHIGQRDIVAYLGKFFGAESKGNPAVTLETIDERSGGAEDFWYSVHRTEGRAEAVAKEVDAVLSSVGSYAVATVEFARHHNRMGFAWGVFVRDFEGMESLRG